LPGAVQFVVVIALGLVMLGLSMSFLWTVGWLLNFLGWLIGDMGVDQLGRH
jgi:hypothetical protein